MAVVGDYIYIALAKEMVIFTVDGDFIRSYPRAYTNIAKDESGTIYSFTESNGYDRYNEENLSFEGGIIDGSLAANTQANGGISVLYPSENGELLYRSRTAEK